MITPIQVQAPTQKTFFLLDNHKGKVVVRSAKLAKQRRPASIEEKLISNRRELPTGIEFHKLLKKFHIVTTDGEKREVFLMTATHDDTLQTFWPGDFVDSTRGLVAAGIFPESFGKAESVDYDTTYALCYKDSEGKLMPFTSIEITDLINTPEGVTYAADGTPEMPYASAMPSKKDLYAQQPYADRCTVLIGHNEDVVNQLNLPIARLNEIVQLIINQHSIAKAGARVIMNVPSGGSQNELAKKGWTTECWQTNGQRIAQKLSNGETYPSGLWMALTEAGTRGLTGQSLKEDNQFLPGFIKKNNKRRPTRSHTQKQINRIIRNSRKNDARNSARYYGNKVNDFMIVGEPLQTIQLRNRDTNQIEVCTIAVIESGLSHYLTADGEISYKRELSPEALSKATKGETEKTIAIISPDGRVLASALMFVNDPENGYSFINDLIDRETHPYQGMKAEKFVFLNWMAAPGKTEYEGVAKALFESVEDEAKKLNIQRVSIDATEGSYGFWKNLGFKVSELYGENKEKVEAVMNEAIELRNQGYAAQANRRMQTLLMDYYLSLGT